ncbi:MAG: DNA mismatch repair protein MutS, partial [Proteobacteria bacterium]|nr:DNA mismatch repair protein MutS [Pseudomonadota bacterium]
MSRRPRLTEQDREQWARYATQVTPLPGRTAPPLPEPPPDTPAPAAAAPLDPPASRPRG